MAEKFIYIAGVPKKPGFNDMFGGWCFKKDGISFLADTGVAGAADDMVKNLKNNGIVQLDYILLTHIHLDHAGGLYKILEAYPEAKAIVHNLGIKHLTNPEKLILGTQKVMGEEMSKIYGSYPPINANRLIAHNDNPIKFINIIETPGHAPHHLCFDFDNFIITGEAAGCPYQDKSGNIFLRPATPTRFFYEEALKSLDKLLSLKNKNAYCAHYNQAADLHLICENYKKQLNFWLETVRSDLLRPIRQEPYKEKLERLTDLLINIDPEMMALKELPDTQFLVERFFMRNNVAGFLDYLSSFKEIK